MQNMQEAGKVQLRDYRLDIIKATCILLVLIWHLEPIDISAPKLQAYHLDLIIKQSIIFLYFQITLLAVPAFILVSLHIYLKKLVEKGLAYFPKRFSHLLFLFTFWVLFQTFVFYLVAVSKSIPFSDQIAGVLPAFSLRSIFMNGGPSLPNVGGSVFYYLSVLLQLTILSTLFFMTTKKRWVATTIGIALIVASLIYLEFVTLKGQEVSLADMRVFALYIPIAYFLAMEERKFSGAFLYVLICGYLLLSVQDYYLRRQGIPFSVYARPSIVFGATALFYGLMNLRSPAEWQVTKLLSEYSLGIFSLHKYFEYLSIVLLVPIFEAYGLAKKIPFGYLRVNVQLILIALLTVLFTFACIFLLSKTPLRRFIK